MPPLKYSDFAMLHESPRGVNAGTIGGSRVPEWLGQTMIGPVLGTFSAPAMRKSPMRYVRVIARMNQRKAA
jgi:hypothetical protein